eukprot:TRINITY_DN1365_c0_g1_i1.p1 TRINITY_DN1365_c0_g1~~TRINITY_DN1365_c0_g1_i1.p1  ORF type:complete len:570 (-),score=147.54 TRINITY_DN1365_c0_g1_i1:73-1782(-)
MLRSLVGSEMCIRDSSHIPPKYQPMDASIGILNPYSSAVGNRCEVAAVLREGVALLGQVITVSGWVKTGRLQNKDATLFVELNDGSSQKNLQLVVDSAVHPLKEIATTGTSLVCVGEIKQHPKNADLVEVHVTKVMYAGHCPADVYPLAKGFHPPEHLRSIAHLRARSNLISAVARVRSALAYATHSFFKENGFLYVHTPLITASDCEGAGEMFQVTTLLSQVDPAKVDPTKRAAAEAEVEDIRGKIQASLARHEDLIQDEKKNKKNISKGIKQRETLEIELTQALERRDEGDLARQDNGQVDYSRDFFKKPSFLTVSGQLNVETYCCGLSSVYTFGPTFRAENSNTTRHLAEFWMIEPEIAFADINDAMRCAEDYVRYCCQYLLDNHRDELEVFDKVIKPSDGQPNNCIERLTQVCNTPFKKISYTEVIEVLQETVKSGHQFEESNIVWGMDLGSEHERYICEVVYKIPCIVYNYPKEIKAFYMKLNEDQKTVAAMDILVPRVGELIGGSEREYRLSVLEDRIAEQDLDLDCLLYTSDAADEEDSVDLGGRRIIKKKKKNKVMKNEKD